jgi:UDP-glucuronate 4-epimerase
LVKKLSSLDYNVFGIDIINYYYNIELKFDRLEECGILRSNIKEGIFVQSVNLSNYKFAKIDIENREVLETGFSKFKFDIVFHLAAQAGVRYSLENPKAYINANIVGYFNVLDLCRIYNVGRLFYASSSSVYGITDNLIFEETDKTDSPASLYAATKKSNELLAHAYSHLYNLKTIGLRFFTVYGPWGRPDMAPYIFSQAISSGEPIYVYNNGEMQRDFTFIDDIINSILLLIKADISSNYSVLNIGNSTPVNLLDFIKCLEKEFDKLANLIFCEMQVGDVVSTWANVNQLIKVTNYVPQVSISKGVSEFVNWYIKYHKI